MAMAGFATLQGSNPASPANPRRAHVWPEPSSSRDEFCDLCGLEGSLSLFRVRIQVNEFPGMVVEQSRIIAFDRIMLQINAGIKIDGYDGLFIY
jgi:hypothetical protein